MCLVEVNQYDLEPVNMSIYLAIVLERESSHLTVTNIYNTLPETCFLGFLDFNFGVR